MNALIIHVIPIHNALILRSQLVFLLSLVPIWLVRTFSLGLHLYFTLSMTSCFRELSFDLHLPCFHQRTVRVKPHFQNLCFHNSLRCLLTIYICSAFFSQFSNICLLLGQRSRRILEPNPNNSCRVSHAWITASGIKSIGCLISSFDLHSGLYE